MFVKYFKQSNFLTRQLSLMPQACTTVVRRTSQPDYSRRAQSADSRIKAVEGWSCNKLLTLDCRRRRRVLSTLA